MALFGDSARFHEERNHCAKTSCFLKSQTAAHLGPGSTYSPEAEDVRMGWKPSRPVKHQPMDSTSNRGDARGDVYLTATLTKDGHIIHKDTKKKSFPAAGQYDPGCVFSPTRKSIGGSVPSSPRARFGEEIYMGTTSPRLNDINLHHGVVVASSPRERRQQSTIGPGSYFTADDTETAGGGDNALLKKSHNRRVSGGNERGYSIHSNPGTPRSSSSRSPRSQGSKGHTNSGGRSRPGSAGGSPSSYFRQYTANSMKYVPTPVLQTPPKRFAQHNYNYNDGKSHSKSEGVEEDNGIEGYANNHAHNVAVANANSNIDGRNSPTTPYVASPKRGIPIGRVYN